MQGDHYFLPPHVQSMRTQTISSEARGVFEHHQLWCQDVRCKMDRKLRVRRFPWTRTRPLIFGILCPFIRVIGNIFRRFFCTFSLWLKRTNKNFRAPGGTYAESSESAGRCRLSSPPLHDRGNVCCGSYVGSAPPRHPESLITFPQPHPHEAPLTLAGQLSSAPSTIYTVLLCIKSA